VYWHVYTGASILSTASLVVNAVSAHGNFFDVVVQLMSSKLNLLIFLNCLVAVLGQLFYVFVYLFFGAIKQVEHKVSHLTH
jgi:hypothetical protein